MRIGKVVTNDFDLHFWYRTNTGIWAHKQNGLDSEKLEGNDGIPYNNASKGWEFAGNPYYNSSVVYYKITQ